eukprot:CAMPEP_0181226128 /NCGR_PEP_ID=MMETSP1096-20121128/32088_1 /TAXON_ID=156174 ORGANISM="Chrysochromulina ericina, Strain CCMP281" /NCGR_SAMPLE_ID=MMETSP1096 /ASSEMBLY_ACC=CAM_ASM_000453 /LENGTH=76 /DNA_ID=CAMNT_0023319443 /DNA_START=518 /DNA_END=745 /DNA_ORIENTATION=-
MTPRSRCANMGANGGVYWKNEELVERASSEKLTVMAVSVCLAAAYSGCYAGAPALGAAHHEAYPGRIAEPRSHTTS